MADTRSGSRPAVAAAGLAMASGAALGVSGRREFGMEGSEPRRTHPRSAFLRDCLLGPDEEFVGEDLDREATASDPGATTRPDEATEVTWRASAPDDAAAAELDAATADAELLRLLAGLDLAGVSQATLLSAIGAFERLRRVVDAGMVAVIAEADRRCFLGDVPLSSLTAEVSARLSISGQAAERRVGEAFDLVQGHPVLWRAMAAGRIDRLKAKIIAEVVEPAARHVDLERFEDLQERLVAFAERTTPTKLRNHAARSVANLVPVVEEEQAHEKAREGRHVWFFEDGDGMATVGASLPAADAVVVKTVLDRAAAKSAKDDERTVAQRRADVFAAIFRQMADGGATPLGPLPVAQGSRPHLLVTVRALDSGGLAPGFGSKTQRASGSDPADGATSPGGENATHELMLSGYGPITVGAAERAVGMQAERAGFASAKVSLVIADPWSGEYRAVMDPPKGLDSAMVFAALRAGRDPLEFAAAQAIGTRGGKARKPKLGRPKSGKPRAGRPESRKPKARKHRPGNDPPIAASGESEASAASAASDQPEPGPKVATNPAIDWKAMRLAAEFVAASDSYRPSAELIRRVLIRDGTCTFSTCAMPAWRCQIDHIVPFDPARPAEDQTREDNLQTVCGGHHELKTSQGWQVSRDSATGIVTWRSPTGAAFSARATYLEPVA